nr:hypothetical protein [uncultured Cohaesibacter sp.]
MNYQTALRQLMNKPYLATSNYREQQGRANRQGASQSIIDFEKAFVRDLRRRGIPFFCHNMFRTPADQDALFVKGVSRARGRESPHVHGLACDCVHSVHAWGLDRHSWQIIGHIGKEVATRLKIPIIWGGDWNDNGQIVLDDPKETLWDPAHWEIADWRTLIRKP